MSRITVGVVGEAQHDLGVTQEEAFRSAIDGMAGAGFAVRQVSLPEWPLFALVHRIVGSVEASSAAGRYDSVRYGRRASGAKNWNEMYLLSRGAAFGTLLKSYLIQGAYFQFERYGAFEDACRIRARLVGEMRRLMAEVDVLALPAVVSGPRGGEAADDASDALDGVYAQFALTLFANVTGQPALCLPSTMASHTGLQLVGPRLSDGRLLALAEYLQKTGRGGN